MSKLFDQQDCAWEIAQIDRAEQLACASRPKEGHEALTGFQAASLDGNRRTPKGGKTIGVHSQWEKLRIRSRMKLLKTGQLMADARFARSCIAACGECRVTPEGNKYCSDHRHFGIVFKRLKWAGEENMATRLAQGRVWGDEDPTEHEHFLNEWEKQYYEDRKTGCWPWVNAQWSLREYGDLGYRGWLQFLYEEGELPYGDYQAEKARLGAT